MEDQKELGVRTKAQKLAAEIYQIYDELRVIIPDVHHRVGSAEPGWIPLEPGSKATIRDYILRDYAQVQHSRRKAPLEIKQQAMACPLSFDVTSNPYIFDIDHFHSRAHLMTELTKLEDDQILLRDIKNELQRKGLSNRILNKLIPTSREQLKVTGLRNIYYNYPKNLWPLSGPVNSAKQDKSPLEYASQTTLDAMHIFANEEDFDSLLTNIKTEFEVDSPEFDELQRKRKEEFLCDRLSRAFDESYEKTSILPCVIEDGNYTCELEFFKGTILGQTATSYCGARAELTLKSLDITTKCLKNKPQLRPGIQAAFRCLRSVIDEEHSSISSQEGIDPPNAEFMRLTGQRMIKVADKSEISHSLSDTSKLLKSSAANNSHPSSSKYTVFNARGSSTSTEVTHELKKKLKKRKNSFESGVEDVKFGKLSELEDTGSTRISPKGNSSK